MPLLQADGFTKRVSPLFSRQRMVASCALLEGSEGAVNSLTATFFRFGQLASSCWLVALNVQLLTCFFVVLVCSLAFVPTLQARESQAGHAYQQGLVQFRYLLAHPKQARFRSSWMLARRYFWKAYRLDRRGYYAPRSLYYLGKTYYELAKRSFVKKDFHVALDYFQRMVLRFPKHPWADDAKMFRARIFLKHLKDRDQAYLELLSIIHNYPRGDMYGEAKKLIVNLDKHYAWHNGMQNKAKGKIESKTGRVYFHRSRLLGIRHWSSDNYTRVVLDLTTDTAFKRFLLPPRGKKSYFRLVIDLSSTALNKGLPKKVVIKDGILRQIRAGRYTRNQSRVVLDINAMESYRVFSLGNPFRIVIDIYAPSNGSGVASRPSDASAKGKTKGWIARSKKVKRSALGNYKKSKRVAGSLIEQLGLDVRTIMLDPGHGGKDPGAIYAGVKEKDINLRLATILGKILQKQGFTVLYTRTTDRFIPLEERTAMANAKQADLFISLHVNANRNHRVRGLEVYYLNLAKSKDAVRVAARENAVSEKKISDLQVILTDLMLNSKVQESNDLAELILKKSLSQCKKYHIRSNGVRQAPFYVLMGAKMPAVLIEVGYITNRYDRKRLLSNVFLRRLALGIARGVASYRQAIKKYARL